MAWGVCGGCNNETTVKGSRWVEETGYKHFWNNVSGLRL